MERHVTVRVRTTLIEVGDGAAVFEADSGEEYRVPVSPESARLLGRRIYERHTLAISIESVASEGKDG